MLIEQFSMSLSVAVKTSLHDYNNETIKQFIRSMLWKIYREILKLLNCLINKQKVA